MKSIITCCFAILATVAQSQIITSTPAFPSQDDEVTIFYDSNLGNGEVSSVIPMYMHTGVITTNSDNLADWQHVQGNWGTADTQVLMSNEGNGIHSFTFTPSLRDWYGVDMDEDILQMAFVFRNASGNLVGRNSDGSDIYFEVSDGTFQVIFQEPTAPSFLGEIGDVIDISAQSTAAANLSLTINGSEVNSALNASSLEDTFTITETGEFEVVITAELDGTESTDTFVVVVPEVITAPAPANTEHGVNILSDNSVILQLYAPFKDNVFVLGDFNDWTHDLDYLMNRTPDGTIWWIQLDGLEPNTKYRFQYSIDNDELRVADVYSDEILDSWNDPFIPASTMDNITEYPTNLTSEAVSVLETNPSEFNWTDAGYSKPEKTKLNIYELLVRDFSEERNFQTVVDTIDYLERLGINAIELMPINEFEGNLSWGYNCSFFFAVDKFYGGKDNFKAFVDACHSRGIAVIMDIALNHSFGQNPQVRMYFDPEVGQYGQTTAQNPYFNQVPTHDFNVGYDYDHSNAQTKKFVKRVLQYWLNEYHVDGYRMDLSKGFTQNNTLGNVGAWGQYDQSRVDILTDYFQAAQEADPTAYFILEHFANNNEETALANLGMMLWGNINHDYNEATMGYASNLDWASYQTRGWNNPHLVSFMESHDEERLMYKNLEFGNSAGAYDITELPTALDRLELASCFHFPIPGPKMTWQFGELGYDYSINHCPGGTISEDCRTSEKPVRWDYLEVTDRADVYEVMSILNYLRNNYDFMHTEDFNLDVNGFGKRIHLNGTTNATIIGNFDVNEISMVPGFQHTGTWYEVFTGEEIDEQNLSNPFLLQPGEYRFYVDQQVDFPQNITNTELAKGAALDVYPNPSAGEVVIILPVELAQSFTMEITDILGKTVFTNDMTKSSSDQLTWNKNMAQLTEGVYIIRLFDGVNNYTEKVIFTD